MPTVIDSLVLELALDTKKFTPAQKDALKALRMFEDQAVKSGKTVESEGKRMDAFFSKLKTQAIGLFAGLMGANGIKDFVSYVTTLDASVGRVSKTMNMSTQEISAWQGVSKQTGGTVEGMTAALQGMNGEMNKVLLGIPTGILPVLNYLQIGLYQTNGQLKTAGQMFFDISKAIEGMDPARARVTLSQLGLPEEVINTLLIGRKSLGALYDEQVRLGIITRKNADQAIELSTAWEQSSQAATSFGRAILNDVSPALKLFLDGIREVFVLARDDNTLQKVLFLLNPFAWAGGKIGKFAGGKIAGATDTGAPSSTSAFGSSGGSGTIPLKAGAGSSSPQTAHLMEVLSGVGGIAQVTALNDAYHRFLGGAHPAGNALDLTVNDPAQAEAVAGAIRAKLAELGISANVINEYAHPSKNSTGGHIHVGLGAGGAELGRGRSIGARAAAGVNINNRAGDSSSSSSSFSVDTIVINDKSGSPDVIASGIEPALRRSGLASFANSGQQ